jgi:hypothetical protein
MNPAPSPFQQEIEAVGLINWLIFLTVAFGPVLVMAFLAIRSLFREHRRRARECLSLQGEVDKLAGVCRTLRHAKREVVDTLFELMVEHEELDLRLQAADADAALGLTELRAARERARAAEEALAAAQRELDALRRAAPFAVEVQAGTDTGHDHVTHDDGQPEDPPGDDPAAWGLHLDEWEEDSSGPVS